MSPRDLETVTGRADHEEILELVGIAVMTINSEGVLLEANSAASLIFGYDDIEMIGQNISMLMPAFHATRHDGYLERYLRTGQSRIIGEGRKVEGRRADGTLFPMHLAVGRFERDGEVFFSGIVHDLSDQERVLDNATRLGRIIDESLNEIFVFDVSTLRFTLVNRGALRNLGYTIEEMRSMSPVDIKPLHSNESFRKLLHPLLRGDLEQLEFQTVHERKDGTRYDVDVVIHLSDAVMPPEIVAIVQDHTEHNRLTAAFHQSQKMEAMGQLTGGVAHDFNNLLTVISGNLELLEMQDVTADQRELLHEAHAASRMGAELTQRLLSFARKSSLAPTHTDLNEAILSLSVLLRRSLGSRIRLTTTLSPELAIVRIDTPLFDSAIMNLVINAGDAMGEEGELTIETSNRRLLPDEALRFDLPTGEYVAVIVSDTGHGIEADNLEQVFDPFFTTRSKSGGNGLGLSMVYGFAKQCGGHITVESEANKGTSFTLWLPKADAGTAEPVSASSSATSAETVNVEPAGRTITILLVDDDERVRRLTARQLRKLHHEVLQAEDGPKALQLFHDTKGIELLLTDMVMPNGMSGYELANAIREHEPELPVIIESGYSEQLVTLERLSDAGIELLRKPYDAAQLDAALTRALGKRSQTV